MGKRILKQIYKHVVDIEARQKLLEQLYNTSNTMHVSISKFERCKREIKLLTNHIKLMARDNDITENTFKQLTKNIAV